MRWNPGSYGCLITVCHRSLGVNCEAMATRRRALTTDSLPPRLRALTEQGALRLPERDLAEVLAEIGRPAGPVSDAGTRALQEQRGDRA